MKYTKKVKNILDQYENTNAGIKANLARILMNGKLSGTGKLLILPVDQGHEHGPDKSFIVNPDAYDPTYHYRLAIEAGLNAYAAPLGFLEAGAETYSGQIPTILKINNSNSLSSVKNQSLNGTVKEALRLGCAAVGFTIYPGSDHQYDISKEAETSIDTIAYAAHIAALLGAHIIKVKPPTSDINDKGLEDRFRNKLNINSLSDRIKHIKECAFNSKRIVVFSGGNAKGDNDIIEEIKQIKNGGGNGSIIGRNTFQRPRQEALILLQNVINIYKDSK